MMINKMCINLLSIVWIMFIFIMQVCLVRWYYHAKNHACKSKGNKDAKQKHLGCKKVRGQSEAALQTGATKNFDIS